MSFPIKIAFNGELRRFLSASAPSYVDVVAAVQQMFPRLGASGFSLKYEDEENELITVASELELAEAVGVCKQLQRKTLKLIVVSRDEDWVSVGQEKEPRQEEEPQPVEPLPSPVVVEDEPVAEPIVEPVQEEVKEPVNQEPPTPELPTKEELVQALVELASDERVQAGLPKLAETALSDASLDALLDPSLPTVELLRNILSSVPEIAAHPSVGRLLAAVAHAKASECIARVREHVAESMVPVIRALRPMLLEALPGFIQQLPTLVQWIVQRLESACQEGDRFIQRLESACQERDRFMPCWFGGQFPFAFMGGEEQAEEEQPQVSAKGEAVHRGITCDGCGTNPIVGVRFQCTVCPNFDLCKACEAKGEHAPSHPLLQLRGNAESAEAVHHNVQCNACGVAPIRGARFKCTVCNDFDLCEACEQKGDHDHPMLKMRRPAQFRGRGHGPHRWMRHAFRGQGPCGRPGMMGAMGMGAQHGAFPFPFPPLFRLFAGRGGAGGCGAWKRGECGAWGKRAESTTANSAFVCDVTLPDGAEIPVGAEMVKTWKFRNDGSQPWPQGTTLVLKRCRGEFETAPLPISRLPNPGEEVEVSATLKALQPGRGRVCYRLVDNTGAPFGRLWADVNAIAPKEEEVKAEPTPVKVEPTPVKVEPTPVKVEPTPVKVEPTTPKVEPEPVKAEPETPKPHKWEIALTALANMGFVDRKLNIKILNKEKGNLERTITRLLDGAM